MKAARKIKHKPVVDKICNADLIKHVRYLTARHYKYLVYRCRLNELHEFKEVEYDDLFQTLLEQSLEAKSAYEKLEKKTCGVKYWIEVALRNKVIKIADKAINRSEILRNIGLPDDPDEINKDMARAQERWKIAQTWAKRRYSKKPNNKGVFRVIRRPKKD